jgi:hypothetical protein
MPTIDNLTKQLERLTAKHAQRTEAQQPKELPTDVVEWAALVELHWDEWQLKLMRAVETAQREHKPLRIAAATSRQLGKSLCAASCALMVAETRKNATILICSPSQRQSILMLRRVKQLHTAQGSNAPRAESSSATMLKLSNGSWIVAVPGGSEATVRGFSGLNCLITDESQFCTLDLWNAVTPMCATVPDNIMLCIGTPHGERSWFHEIFATPNNGWLKFEIKATDVPNRIPASFLAEERLRLGPFFEREYMVSWKSFNDDSIFRPESLERCIVDIDSLDYLLDPIIEGAELQPYDDHSRNSEVDDLEIDEFGIDEIEND